jgi:pilus assembly protein CpaC
VSELDNANGVTLNGNRIPGLRTRWVDTAVEMQAGQTLALAGLIQTRIEAQNRGIPWLADLPWAGAAFRRVQEQQNEIELVVTVRPELVDALDPQEVPECLPGQQSASPNDVELYFRGYLEVPNCCPDGNCANCQNGAYESTSSEIPAPTEAEPAAPADSAPPAADGARSSLPPSSSFGSRPVWHTRNSISGRQIAPGANGGTGRSADDPGLVGRVGYDVLDYKE